MTVSESGFPIGYFYIISKMNGMCLDLRGDPKEAQPGTKIVMLPKKPESPERDSQLWIHQDGFLTNKASGLVLDINPSESFMAIFTKEKRLYLDRMKEADAADDQKFGFAAEPGYIYKLAEPEKVLDIRNEDSEPDARVMLYKRKEEDNLNQLWTVELADPPQMVDSDDEEEDDSKRARLRAWFGSWKGWGDDKKKEVLDEEKLHEAHRKIYEDEEKKKKSHLSYELIAGAVAWQAYNMWEKKQEEEGKEVDHSLSKKLIASFAAAELVKVLSDRGENDDDEKEGPSMKKRILTDMAVSAATNFFESRHGSK